MIAMSITLMSFNGCALATGELFGSYCKSAAYNPKQAKNLFSYTLLGFALVETFTFMLLGIVAFLYSF